MMFHANCFLRIKFAWNVKAYFLGKKENYYQFVVCLINSESGKGERVSAYPQQTHNVAKTSLQRRCNVTTL